MSEACITRRWTVVVSAVLIQLSLGAIYAWSDRGAIYTLNTWRVWDSVRRSVTGGECWSGR